MKQVIIGDIHGRGSWKDIVEAHPDADRFIFLGDYLDTHEDVTGLEQVENLREIIKFKEISDKFEVILLIGNHDHHYWPSIGYTGTSGYQPAMAKSFEYEFETFQKLFQMAYVDENSYIFTHAGITESFLYLNGIGNTDIRSIVDSINDLFNHKPNSFTFHPGDRSGCGDHIFQSPIWVRPSSLYRDGIKQLQIVGHTTQTSINPLKSARQNYWLVDTLGTSEEYLVITDGVIEIHKL